MSAARQVIEAFFAASQRGDLVAMRALLADDFVITEAPSLPYGGRYEGGDAMMALVRQVFRTWKKFQVETVRIIGDDGDMVSVLARIRGEGGAGNVPFAMMIGEFWRVRDGKACEVLPLYFDTKLLHDLHFGS